MPMESHILAKGVLFSFMTTTGLLGNCFVFLAYLLIACQQQKLVSAEILLLMLALANLLYDLTLALPHTVFIFHLKYLLSDEACKADLYLARISRALSICLTSLLSSCQCAALASRRWRYFRLKSVHQLCLSASSMLLISMASSISTVFFSAASGNATSLNYTFHLGYCLVIYPDRYSFHLIGFATFARDLVFVVIMAFSSTYILLILYRHARQVRGMRSSDRMNQGGAESQAIKMVVTLVVVYVIIFGLDNTLWFYQFTLPREIEFMTDLRFLLSAAYASIFPIVVLSFNRKVSLKLFRLSRIIQRSTANKALDSRTPSGMLM
ncbi:olfactory receptor class A-like protein 1 [Ambystoma mexicanum]|uniref:olfactory receptor class A-like protein 1 n=1 Tax=Ambystoma mexicanum TaxID=8296 RepID=UPI0037E85DE0